MTEIAVLGTGRMGTPIAHRLLAAGHPVTVWNRTAARAEPLRRAGARVAATPAEAVRGVHLAVTMLTDPAAVDTVLFGSDGAAAALPPGACLVEMSTIGPDAVRALARRLPDDVHLVDAPVGGSVDAAAAGRLRILAGGPAAAVERVGPVLAALGTVRHLGPTGAGAAAKLVLNTALLVGVAGVADALSVARAAGVGREAALDLLREGPLGAAVARATAVDADFPIALAGKDLGLVLGDLAGTAVPLVRAAQAALAAAPDPAADIATLTTPALLSTLEHL
ncbi:NAD(P)-dependent oxidoreductase [Micromonospora sp. WMMD812]|uniref:NAD(P)-dependent oxidoreductase n=1 Tax=Micromonospora sp. WMMD812 TaxID=3015152 RepID=UPI00248AF240|nr:NAD(P)-dependent oxidoreductase [Micromonospora sp. WMMD812]WBB68110.1 NAD(P)-dependent oxidoreductase [Micromonospora sp. WMMD812]